MEKCLALQAQGISLTPIHYDDLIARPAQVSAELLDHCGLSREFLPAMLAPLREDSQAGSVIERSRQQRNDLTPADRQIIRDVLARSDIIDSGTLCLPGTLGAAAT
jgi:hypothetical protein